MAVETEADVVSDYGPAPGAADIEAKISIATVRRSIWVAPPLIAIFAVGGGVLGAMSALGGVVIVVGNFVLAGFVLSKAAAISLKLYHAAALFGFLLRLALIMLVMVVLARVIEVDRLAMGVAAVVSYLVLLAWEAVAVSRGEAKELEWS